MSPLWSALLTWEGHCKLHLVFICIFSYLSRWGTRYDHGDSTVRRTLLHFAEDKLLCAESSRLQGFTAAQKYAVLSQRLALDTNTTNYLFRPLDPYHAVRSMDEQIAKHMRVCMAVEDGIETLRGVAPSEPILSEAASRIMSTDRFSLLSALSLVLSGYFINRGDRGELVVAFFFTWARDQVVKSIHNIDLHRRLCPYFTVHRAFRTSICRVGIQNNARQPAVTSTPRRPTTVIQYCIQECNDAF